DDLQLFDAVQVIVGIEQLVWRMNLNHPDPQADDLLHVCQNVRRVPWMHAAARDQAPGILLNVVRHESVDLGCEAHDLGSNVVDEHGTLDPNRIQMLEKGLGRAAEFDHLLEIGLLLSKSLERPGLEHLHGLNVDMTVGDQEQFSVLGSQFSARAWLPD